jgi:hypothetical protein
MHAETKIPRGIESTIQAATLLSTMAMMGPPEANHQNIVALDGEGSVAVWAQFDLILHFLPMFSLRWASRNLRSDCLVLAGSSR